MRRDLLEIAGVQCAHAVLGKKQQSAFLVHPGAVEFYYAFARMRLELPRRLLAARHPQHERRVFERSEDPLRAVLEEPAPPVVALEIAADKRSHRRIRYALALDQPLPAPIQREPA